MEPIPKIFVDGARPVFYAGRFADEVSGAGLPENCRVLSDWDVLPSSLATAMRGAASLVVLDVFSFPFETMTEEQWDVPLVAALPGGFDGEFLEKVFGEPLLERLSFFDRVTVRGADLWDDLSRRYGWSESQRILLEDEDPANAALEIAALLEAEAIPRQLSGGPYETYSYWSERGDEMARSAPRRAICSGRPGRELDKAMHRVQATALEEQFAAARGGRAQDVPFEVLEVGAGVGRWVASFDPTTTRFYGVDISGDMIEAARDGFPEARFDRIGRDLILPYEDESFDLLFTVDVLHHNPAPSRLTMLSEMWRVARPGGRLLFLEDFVAEKRSPDSTVYPMPVREFVDLVIEASVGRVTLEHVESLRYPRDDVVRAGLISLSKLGVPKRW